MKPALYFTIAYAGVSVFVLNCAMADAIRNGFRTGWGALVVVAMACCFPAVSTLVVFWVANRLLT